MGDNVTNLYLIRHGETNQNKNNIVQGRMDNPLNDTGKNQAIVIADWFNAEKIAFDVLYTSPLQRAKQTALFIQEKQHCPLRIEDDLIERNFGAYDGKMIEADYFEQVLNETIPEMEKHHDLEQRVNSVLEKIANKHQNQTIGIVCHSHVIKAFFVKHVPGFTYQSFLKNCSINHVAYDDSRTFRVLGMNYPSEHTKPSE